MVQSDASMRFPRTSNMQLSCQGNCVSVIQHIGKSRIPPQRRRNPNPAIRDTNGMLNTVNNAAAGSDDIVACRPLRMFHCVQSQFVKNAHHFNEGGS